MGETSPQHVSGVATGREQAATGDADATHHRGGATGSVSGKHSRAALALALIPFAAMCGTVSLWDRIHPMVLGLPFNLFWLAAWELLTVPCLAFAYRLESARTHRHDPAERGQMR